LVVRPIPIIADSYVDKEFGTGVLKVTPAHDFNDYELGKKHNLPLINILEPNGKLNANAGLYDGLSITEARERVIEDLIKCNALVKTEAIVQQIGICQRCESIVEPVVSDQWFMKMKPLAEKAIEAARKGESLSLTEVDQCNDTFKIIPETWYSTYYHWMENIRDWCISRQLWWGHRVPAWYCKACKSVTVSAEEPKNCKHCHSHEIYQDEDVLDTWFSAGLWPFATLGWPEKTAAYQKFYPGSILETGFDILFFWVARMLMLGLHFNDGKIPFRRVYLHAMVRDEKGKKMSKTKGNVIDPLAVIEKYGADAFRFTLLSMSGQGRDIKLNTDRVEGYKAFCNKLWNASRYVMMRLGFVESDLTTAQEAYKHSLKDAEKWIKENRSNLHAINKWILSRFETTADSINKAFEEFRMGEASLLLYDFIWKDFCDWYIEFSKELLKDANIFHETQHCLVYLLHKTLRLAHPFIPFITEEIYKHIPETNKSESTFLILQPWPCTSIMEKQTEAEDTVELWKDVIEHLRTFRGENGISPKARPEVYFDVNIARQNIFHAGLPFIVSIAQLGHLLPKSDDLTDQTDISEICCNSARLYVSLRGLVDVEGEVSRLEKEKHKIQNDINFLQTKLNRQEFLARAPKDLVKLEQERLGTFNNNLESINKAIERLLKIKS
ncbi:MAG: valine--tRNA ligase, partial [Bdellovibrio sp.]|nr:valine--tRNA ligase [Bdellovibrio sp.]